MKVVTAYEVWRCSVSVPLVWRLRGRDNRGRYTAVDLGELRGDPGGLPQLFGTWLWAEHGPPRSDR